jgi:hypothetical protein
MRDTRTGPGHDRLVPTIVATDKEITLMTTKNSKKPTIANSKKAAAPRAKPRVTKTPVKLPEGHENRWEKAPGLASDPRCPVCNPDAPAVGDGGKVCRDCNGFKVVFDTVVEDHINSNQYLQELHYQWRCEEQAPADGLLDLEAEQHALHLASDTLRFGNWRRGLARAYRRTRSPGLRARIRQFIETNQYCL